MKAKILLLTIVVTFSCGVKLQAQTNNLTEKQNYKWGFEFDIVQPLVTTVEIFNIQLTRTIVNHLSGQKGDLVIGAYIRPNVKHDVVEEIDEYMLLVAYRHYFWNGFHAEAGMNTGYYWGWNNLIDGKDYEGLGMFWEVNIGYKFDLGVKKRFYIIPQFGALGNVMADIGPRGGKPDNFIQGNLLIGVNF
jgi:hypothetical protein